MITLDTIIGSTAHGLLYDYDDDQAHPQTSGAVTIWVNNTTRLSEVFNRTLSPELDVPNASGAKGRFLVQRACLSVGGTKMAPSNCSIVSPEAINWIFSRCNYSNTGRLTVAPHIKPTPTE